jgi:hypothetical protein
MVINKIIKTQPKGRLMARYSKKAQETIKKIMAEYKEGNLMSGHGGRPVTNRRQAIAIGLSQARKKGEVAPPRRTEWNNEEN